jgi:monovalent cation:H+ antiporter-2, CPA2 family
VLHFASMNELAPIIKDLAVILGIASIVVLLFQRIRQPVVLGYIIAGIIVGPYTPPHILISDVATIKVLSELGIIFLMFVLGLDFSFHKLKRVSFSAGIVGVSEVALMMVLGTIVGWMFIKGMGNWNIYDNLFLGAAIAISSTTIIIKALDELNLRGKRFAHVVQGLLIVEDLVAILLLVALSTVVVTKNVFSLEMVWAIVRLVVVVGGWFLIGYFAVPTIFRRIVSYASQETITIVSIALCLLLVTVAAYFHYSAALAAFIMGSILAETPMVSTIAQSARSLRDIFAAVFFVSIGMLIDPRIIFNYWQYVLIITATVIVGKILFTSIGAFLTGQSYKTALRVGFSMAQVGEFSFIIASLGFTLGVTDNVFYQIIVVSSAITAFTTPYFIRFSGYLSNRLDGILPERIRYSLDNYSAWVYRLLAHGKKSFAYHKLIFQLMLHGIIVAIIFAFTGKLLLPRIGEILLYGDGRLARGVSWVCAIVLSSPFIWGMLFSCSALDREGECKIGKNGLRCKKLTLTLPLFLTWLIAVLEIVALSVAYFHTWLGALVLVIVAVGFFGLLYRQLGQSYYWFRRRLVSNIRRAESQQERYEELAPWDTHLVEVLLNHEDFPFAGKTLSECQFRQKYGINVVAIKRGNNAVLVPRGDAHIQPYDKLIVLGNDEQIDNFKHMVLRAAPRHHEEEVDWLANFVLQGIVINKGDPLLGTTIRCSKIGERVHGMVVGLERKGVHILNPDYATELKAGDMLLVVGEKALMKELTGVASVTLVRAELPELPSNGT